MNIQHILRASTKSEDSNPGPLSLLELRLARRRPFAARRVGEVLIFAGHAIAFQSEPTGAEMPLLASTRRRGCADILSRLKKPPFSRVGKGSRRRNRSLSHWSNSVLQETYHGRL
jgi:hypothetical protein